MHAIKGLRRVVDDGPRSGPQELGTTLSVQYQEEVLLVSVPRAGAIRFLSVVLSLGSIAALAAVAVLCAVMLGVVSV